MPDKELKQTLKNIFRQSFQEEIQPERLEETIKICTNIIRAQQNAEEDKRTGFWQYLSDIFRFDGFPILILQAITLFLICLSISSIADTPAKLPIFMPFFILALLPVLFRSRYHKMSEIEAVTRASGAQIVLAKLILAGGANLICITVLLCFEIRLYKTAAYTGQLILYAIVPYLACMALLLRSIRLKKNNGLPACALKVLALSLGFGITAIILPEIYEISAIGIWVVAFFIFGAFYLNEIIYILKMKKRGQMYGIVA